MLGQKLFISFIALLMDKMNLFSLFSQSSTLLNEKKEETYAFMYYRRINDLPLLNTKKNSIGVCKRIGVFFYNVFIRMSFVNPVNKKADYLFYSGSKNQYDSLLSTFVALSERTSVIYVLDDRWLDTSNEFEKKIRFTPKVVTVAFFLFFIRSFRLYKRLKSEKLLDSVTLYFDRFCSVYFYVPYYIDLLNRVEPKYILMSNDHSPANRALLYVAKLKGVKTVYLQHASVTKLFPPLEFDYSFLDGKGAYTNYKEIQSNENGIAANIFKNKYIFLSGQKKIASRKNKNNSFTYNNCGVGFTHLDSNEFIIKVINCLLNVFEKCFVRLHPSHSYIAQKQLRSFFKNDNVMFTTGKDELLIIFISHIDVFFGSNTSLHLEIALSGIRSFYLENEIFKGIDPFGYKESGLVIPILLSDINTGYILRTGLLQKKNEIDAVKDFSATYNTSWFGREGELVFSVLEDIDRSLMLDTPLSINYMNKDSNSNMWSV